MTGLLTGLGHGLRGLKYGEPKPYHFMGAYVDRMTSLSKNEIVHVMVYAETHTCQPQVMQ